ncbi:MAG: DUF4837 family protein [Ignavibacteriales bacterium]|nr:DUF4837 family protein [Ignavibacteriales bacterium]
MIARRSATAFVVIALVAAFGACETKERAKGLEDEVVVVADSSVFSETEEALRQVFEQTIITPQEEKLFKIIESDFRGFNHFKEHKSVVMVGALDMESDLTSFLKSTLDSGALAQIREESGAVIVRKDVWAREQAAIFIVAPTVAELEFKILQNADRLLYAVQKASDERLLATIYNPKYENKAIQGHLLKEYGWTIFAQLDFRLAMDRPEDNFVWLRRGVNTDAERWVFVHWIENGTPAYFNLDSVVALRNRVTEKFYRTSDNRYYVEIADEALTSREANFNERYALFTQGLWRMTDRYMGGPFVNYIFIDEKTGRLYMLDGSIFAPKYTKRNLIHQIDVMLQSWRGEYELSEGRKETLLEAAKEFVPNE